jgi:hypothetical protein
MIKKGPFKYWGMGMLLGMSCIVHGSNIDIYGASPQMALTILKDYGDKVSTLEQKRIKFLISHRETINQEQSIKKLIAEISSKYKLPPVTIDSIYYPDKKQVFTTINICDPRLTKGLIKDSAIFNYQVSKNPDVVDKMIMFLPKAAAFIVLHPEYTNKLNCLDYQCITPEHPEFEKDLAYFRGTVPKQQRFIEATIEKDPVNERRRAAIFLLAYLKNPEEIARVLNTVLDDENSYVRHDGLRVYGELYAKAHISDVPVAKIIKSLYSCNTAERNKALIFLNELAKEPKYQTAIIEQAGEQLMTLLELRQPNNHDFAYQILRKISHKDYSDKDYAKWQLWLKHVSDKAKLA